jgi:crossover junction endodeoxyribonuclease RuvC
MSVVLGLDPGTRHFGWGVVERRGQRLVHVAHGVVATNERESVALRLVVIERSLVEVLESHRPSQASIEALFYAKDPQAAAKLGHARGVALLVCARAGLGIHEYAPTLVKRAVTGSGRADKAQVAQMVRVVLALAGAPPSDAADALAAAITHLQRAPLLALAPGFRRA